MPSKAITRMEHLHRIEEYLERAGDEKKLNYALDHVATYKMYSGYPESGDREFVGYFRGRFIDVVAKIVTMGEMGGWYLDSSNAAGNPNGGCIIAEDPPVVQEIPADDELAKSFADFKKMKKEKITLEKRMLQIDAKLR